MLSEYAKLGFEYINWPLILSSDNSKLVLKLIPLPKKFFSVIPPPIVDPLVPTPADKLISPVGCSSTFKLIIFKLSLDPSTISELTFLNIPKDFN